MKVEILCTGDEILTGKTINTNYSHMARRLGDVGLDVVWGTTVGDDRASLLAAFHQAGARADAVIVNGGLGPTVDDLSQEVAAEACGVPLVLSDYWMQRMTESYARRGRVMPANNRKQAMLPDGRGVHRQPDRHGLRLRGHDRQGAVPVHARRAARDAAHARRADHPAPAEAERHCQCHAAEALPYLRHRREPGRRDAGRHSRAWRSTATSSSASRRTIRSSRPSWRCAAPTRPTSTCGWRRSRRRCASGSATSSSPRTTSRWKA